ncbi:RNA 2',3'-cyclic phosphodiesterase [Deinococcus alpinitundrae]|uniref:RNA 2',3'-cyclic phosphodiesterase n=1 Tax=Deinococcus alpinitundrae TaxID=468913 RepID=UPI00137B314D|nr:RNA 2',3'-cyclic phosphodiesterase [Deinococcus alpinitundrae]
MTGPRRPGKPTDRASESRRPDTRKPGKPATGQRGSPPPVSTHEARPRLFYALKVPPEVAEQLAAIQKELRGNWRSVRADQLHVTLAYLPGIDPSKLDALKALGDTLTQTAAPLSLKLRGTGYFPNEGSPRVWFVKVEAEGLEDLAARLRVGLAELGVETDNLPFKAHITLARKKGAAPRVPPKLLDSGWDAGAVTLYRSHLQKTGPIYENLAMFKLRGELRANIMSSTESEAISTAALNPEDTA